MSHHTWGYGKDDGPATWAEHYPKAAGKKQSPVNIVTSEVEHDHHLAHHYLHIDYHKEHHMEIINTGESVMAKIEEHSTIKGGPLGHTYQLAQFHFHWGDNDHIGSEHLVDGHQHAAELHFVHWNKDKYSSIDKATMNTMVWPCSESFSRGEEHKELKHFTDRLHKVKFSHEDIHVKGHFNPAHLLPKDTTDHWTYDGSLTTPPNYEIVKWIVFKEAIEVSEHQLKTLRSLRRDREADHLEDNYRPTCPLGDRIIRASFK